MKPFIQAYHLKEGLFISFLFPIIFFLLNFNSENIPGHFIFSLVITFSFWIINSLLLHFKKNKHTSNFFFAKSNIVGLLTSSLLAIIVYVSFGSLLTYWNILVSAERGNWGTSFKEWYYLCIKIILLNAIIILVKYLADTGERRREVEFENEVLKRENLNAMHEALKQQVNPHFLFNSLNTLKSLTKRSPEKAMNFIDELSKVYRYMLLHQNKNVVMLADEITFLKSYLYLLKIRFGDAINTEINLPEDCLANLMPPNTLQLLIENAVKHNIVSQRKPLSIFVFLQDEFLVIQNNLQPKQIYSVPSGLGLNNISQRYKLILGKDISIEKKQDNFMVFLPLR